MANQIFSQILIYLTDFSIFIKNFTGDIGASGVHYNWLVIFFFVFIIFIVAISFGRSRTLLALLSLYAASFLESHFIYFDKLREIFKNLPDHWFHIGLFLVIYVVTFTILNRSFLKRHLTLAESSVFLTVLVGIVEMGFLATILISYFPTEWLNKISSLLAPYFATEEARFWWSVAPLIVLLFSKRRSAPAN